MTAAEQTRRELERGEREFPTLPKELQALAASARILTRKGGEPARGKCIVYWMQRAQRALDNPALDLAVAIGNALSLPVVAMFSAIETYPNANLRHYAFMGPGFADTEQDCEARNVGFVLRRPPNNRIEGFLSEVSAAVLVGDENPIRAPRAWREHLAERIRIPFFTVDADVAVPSRLLGKAQYMAHTARPRFERLRAEWLKPCANLKADREWKKPRGLESYPTSEDLTSGWKKLDRSVGPVDVFTPGTHAAQARLKHFMAHKLKGYAEQRNHPETDHTTRLSPYLHFGQISPITIALAARKAVKEGRAGTEDLASLDNELLLWRELAVNFVTYQDEYDSWKCAEPWAMRSLTRHVEDKRPVLYSLEQLRDARTHDELWNAAQSEMVRTGFMHNRMRMYWGKKILEWSPNPAVAFERTIILNDSYELDGRDPSSYMNIAWAIVGKFDRPWFERPIFGQVRYMSRESTGKKFDSKAYIAQQSEQAKLFQS